MQRITTVILDLDNTLFDWVDVWYKSFSAMLEELAKASGVDRDVLILLEYTKLALRARRDA